MRPWGSVSDAVVVLAYDGIQSLDLVGPVEVFDVATRHRIDSAVPGRDRGADRRAGRHDERDHDHARPRPCATSAATVDTFVVAGGTGRRDRRSPTRRSCARCARVAKRSRRVASVCTGAFLLAEAGLLDGRRVTTHWASCRRLAAPLPRPRRSTRDPIFVRDGDVYTSAGVTAGIDLCLALVEEDHGRELALAVARQLVVFLKRPGGQAQFSSHLSTQLAERDVLAEVQGWIADHLDEDLSVPRLAERAAMSPRHFARVFRAETGVTPARFVERARVEQARRRLEESGAGIEEIAHGCGFGTPETMRRAFLRALRVGPAEYRQRFRAATEPALEVRMTTTGILIFDGAEELDFVGPYEVFTMARHGRRPRRADRRVDPMPVRCAKGMRVLPDHTLADAPYLDVLVVPGRPGDPARGRQPGADRLDPAGRARLHLGHQRVHRRVPAPRGRHPATSSRSPPTGRRSTACATPTGRHRCSSDVRYVRDGNVVTAAGVSAGIDMALWVVGQVYGVEHARVTQYAMEYDPAPPYAAVV